MLIAATAGLAGVGLTPSLGSDRVLARADAIPAADSVQLVAVGTDLRSEQALFVQARDRAGVAQAGLRAQAAVARLAAARSRTTPAGATSRSQTRATLPILSPSAARQLGLSLAAAAGWSQTQVGCLDTLWTRESGWVVSASNPTSGAYGIPQALPGWKMSSFGSDWRSSARTQIRWGLSYIQASYGGACSALSHARDSGLY